MLLIKNRKVEQRKLRRSVSGSKSATVSQAGALCSARVRLSVCTKKQQQQHTDPESMRATDRQTAPLRSSPTILPTYQANYVMRQLAALIRLGIPCLRWYQTANARFYVVVVWKTRPDFTYMLPWSTCLLRIYYSTFDIWNQVYK